MTHGDIESASPPPWRPSLPLAVLARLARHAAQATRGSEPFDADRLDRRDPRLIAAIQGDLAELNRRWLNLSVEGLSNVSPAPCVYAANHNGGIMGPDLFCTLGTLWRTLGAEAPLYAMAHDFAMRRVQPLGRLLQRIGAMRACPRNARRVLEEGGSVLVYPGGDLDAYRRFDRRDQVVFGARTGFVKIAREARVPIVPIVASGAHRSAIIFHEGAWLARTLGLTRWSRLQRFPLALALPWGLAPGPWLPYAPLPFPIRLRVLSRIDVTNDADLGTIRDDVVARMQRAMDEMTTAAA